MELEGVQGIPLVTSVDTIPIIAMMASLPAKDWDLPTTPLTPSSEPLPATQVAPLETLVGMASALTITTDTSRSKV